MLAGLGMDERVNFAGVHHVPGLDVADFYLALCSLVKR
jgi:hypothetical protein